MKVAIIGGGFSATSLILELLAKRIPDLSIILIEKGALTTHGVAFDTPFGWHLLNVRANKMGALSDDQEGFFRWAKTNESSWRQSDPVFREIILDQDEFLPRKLYGIYLASLLDEARKNGSLTFIQAQVTDVQAQGEALTLSMEGRAPIEVDKVVLAIGVPAIRELSFVEPSHRYIPNLWNCKQDELLRIISSMNQKSVIFIIGTGLTMVDMVTTLWRLNFPGKIVAFSRHGTLPAVHTQRPIAFDGSMDEILNGKNLLEKFKEFREKLKKSGWHELVDALRPYTIELWKQLSMKDKRRFMRHLLPLWNKHRHRMAPQSYQIIRSLQKENRLQLLSGTILSIREKEVKYQSGDNTETLQVDYVFNCTGPDFTLRKREDDLIQNMLRRKFIQPDDLGLGIKIDDQFRAVGPLSDNIFVMGALLYGDRFETTSAPDIRNHAKAVAEALFLGLRSVS